MFRIPFPFSRLFRLRGRRTARADANLRRSSSALTSFKSPQSASAPTRDKTAGIPPAPSSSSVRKRPHSLFVKPFSGFSPISKPQSTPLPPSDAILESTPTPTIVIGRGTDQEFPVPLPQVPTPSGHVIPQVTTDGVPIHPPTQANTRVSCQLPTTLSRIDDRPETPLSTCSTLITEIKGRRDGEGIVDDQTGSASGVPTIDREPIAASNDEAVRSGSVAAPSAASAGRSAVTKARHASLLTPQPVRPDGVRANRSRFSLPARPKTQTDERRASLLSLGSSSGSTLTPKKEGRMARFSREMSDPETQEILRALAWRM